MQKRLRKDKIFIFASIIFLFTLICTYGYRFIHYYRLEHKNPTEEVIVTNKSIYEAVIAKFESGEDDLLNNNHSLMLDENTDEYYFYLKSTNNYVYYSGRLFRIISVDKNNNIKMIADEVQTSIYNGDGSNYNETDINKWLNKGNNNEGIFYNSLNGVDTFLVKTNSCTDKVDDITKTTCKSVSSDNLISSLSAYEYVRAGANESFLNNNTYFWTSSFSGNGETYYVFGNGGLNKTDEYVLYGVRPVITLKGETIVSGSGLKDNPYKFEERSDDKLSTISVGEYINYSNYNFRVIEKNDDSIKVVLDGYIKDGNNEVEKSFSDTNNVYSTKTKANVGYYLNNDFYNSLENKDYLVKGDFYIGMFTPDSYGYKILFNNKVNAYVGIPRIGELFINEYSNILTLSGLNDNVDKTIYVINSENKLYADNVAAKYKIRPVLYLDNTLKTVSGSGLKDNPYVIGR